MKESEGGKRGVFESRVVVAEWTLRVEKMDGMSSFIKLTEIFEMKGIERKAE